MGFCYPAVIRNQRNNQYYPRFFSRLTAGFTIIEHYTENKICKLHYRKPDVSFDEPEKESLVDVTLGSIQGDLNTK